MLKKSNNSSLHDILQVYKCHHEHHGILAVKRVEMEPHFNEMDVVRLLTITC